MAFRLRLSRLNWLTGGLHALILSGAAHAHSARAWPFALAAMSLVSFAAWIGNYRRLRQIADTPLSNIANAAQGYVEIAGTAQSPGGSELTSKLSLTPCVWYSYVICERTKNEWTEREAGASEAPFIITEGPAQCLIDPRGAEIVCARERTWTQGDYLYTEALMLPLDKVYALGQFETVGGANSQLDLKTDVNALLARWKDDQPELLRRFDLDKNGAIDLKEWELARRQAVREVQVRHNEIRSSTGTNVLRAPDDGRVFLLSTELPSALRLRFLRWAWTHAFVFVAAAGASIAMN